MSAPALRALGARNFRLYLAGQGLSLIGTWMQQLAMSWLVYRLTRSPAHLGAAVFAAQIPMLFLSPFAGVFVDRLDRRRVVIITQSLLLLQAVALAVLASSPHIRFWHIIALNLFFGVVNSLDMPSRQSMVIDLVDRPEDLGNAIALNSSVVNVTRLVGPALAGLVIAAFGEFACFLLNALSFLAVLISLFQIRLKPRPPAASTPGPVLKGLREGLAYAFGFTPIQSILILLSVVSLCGMPYTVFMPMFATELLRGGPHTLGFLAASSGLGALVASVYLATRDSLRGLMRRIAACAAIFGAGLVGFAHSRSFLLSVVALFFVGFGAMVMMAASNTVLQTLADEDKRGRVMSFYVTSLMGLLPVGAGLSGSIAARIGETQMVTLGGFCCVAAAALFGARIPRLRKVIRPIYIRKGIMADPAAELAGPLKS